MRASINFDIVRGCLRISNSALEQELLNDIADIIGIDKETLYVLEGDQVVDLSLDSVVQTKELNSIEKVKGWIQLNQHIISKKEQI